MVTSLIRLLTIGLLLVISVGITGNPHAQTTDSPAALTADNIAQFQSTARVDFDGTFKVTPNDPLADAYEIDAEIDLAHFVIDHAGNRIAIPTQDDRTLLFDSDGFLRQVIPAPTLPDDESVRINDIAFSENNVAVLLVNRTHVFPYDLDNGEFTNVRQAALRDQSIQDIWVNDSIIWQEVTTADGASLVQYEPISETEPYDTLPYAPATDSDAVVRIGRIPAPYAVTSSLEGDVTLWDLQTGDSLYDVNNEVGEPSVFGAINAAATHLVWRDSPSEVLYLLDFEADDNRMIAELGGQYAQWLFLSPDASAALAVMLGGEPIIAAWNLQTGDQTNLGEFRRCGRAQPDRAAFSEDGTMLVIGCATGLDIWRVTVDEDET